MSFLFIWNDSFLTHLPSVDAQHQRLVKLINDLGEMVISADEVDPQKFMAARDILLDFAVTHFSDEEAQMAKTGLDPRHISKHRAEHQSFVDEILPLSQTNGVIPPEQVRALVKYLVHWLAYHILSIDQSMARQMHAIREGQSAAQAFDREAHFYQNTGTDLLLTALSGLFQIVSKRNQELRTLNQELEQRVRQHTTELEKSQSQLVHAEKMAGIGQLAAGVAHEINNPISFVHSNLTSLEGYLRDLFAVLEACEQTERMAALRQELDLDFLRQDIPLLLGESREGIARVKTIVQNLRDFTHINGNKDWHWENLSRCLDNTLDVMRGALPERIEIIREYGETVEIECHPSHLNQAFLNILLNAAQSIEGTGAIRVRTGQKGGQAWVEISDNGCGIPAEVLPRIFEPFFTTRPVGSGTGLGLSATFNIIEQHHGRIEAESTPGKGTLMRVYLPVKQPAARGTNEPGHEGQ